MITRFLRQTVHQFVALEKLLGDDPQHRIERYRHYHAARPRQRSRDNDDKEYLQRMRLDAVGINHRLEHEIIDQIRADKNSDDFEDNPDQLHREPHVQMVDEGEDRRQHRPDDRP